MSLLLKSSKLLRRVSVLKPAVSYSTHHDDSPATDDPLLIGDREIVGYGFNGRPHYIDRPDFPFPAIRFKRPTPDIKALHEKEKGDWKKLTIEEKKQLYRASYCQTFAEMEAPTGEWKSIVGGTLFFVSLALWMYMGLRVFAFPEDMPERFSVEHQQAQLQRILDLQMNPIEGISSKWDYEKNEWKK